MYEINLFKLVILGSFCVAVIFSKDVSRVRNEYGCEQDVGTSTEYKERAQDIFSEFWEWRLLNAPEFATFIGEYKYDDRLDEMSLSSYLRREDESKIYLEKVKKIQRHAQSSSMSANLEILESQLSRLIYGQQFRSYLWPMNVLEGPQLDFPRLLSWMKKDTKDDVIKIIKRMRVFTQQIDESIMLMKEGIRVGLTMHKISIGPLVDVLKKMATEHVVKSPVFKPFAQKPSSICDTVWQPLVTDAKNIIKNLIQTSYLRLSVFIEKTYLRHTRPHIGAYTLPNGRAYYAACLKYHTSTNLTARQIHDIGEREVKRITQRMMKVKKQVKYKGSLKDFRDYLRTDLKFNYSNGEEIINTYKTKGKVIHALLSKYFSVLPKTPYQIVPIPASVAPSFPAAFYLAPPKDGSRPGTFYINTYKPESRKRYEAVALSLHEAEPGHHLQGALTMEDGSSLDFRRFMDDRKYYEPPASFPKDTAYVEGWGLYAEYLGEEMGVYSDPYDMFGRLSHETLRACRLVVDTGMHALGWSRAKAVKYMSDHTAMDMHDIVKEIDRYITWPGQACGYKIGELKIREVRKHAETSLGAKFDVRKFHTLIAAMGGVPLDFMERQVGKFIKKHS